MTDAKQTAAETLALLEERLRRVDYILNGNNTARDTTDDSESNKAASTATQRLHQLERSLAQLTARSPAAAQVLALQKAHPAIFHPTTSATTTPLLPPTQLSALVLAHSHLYTSTSTSLTHLSSSQNSIPDPAQLTQLIALRPRLEKIMAKQEEHEREVGVLRARSARAVQGWVEGGCLGMGEKWAEWEERLRGVEIAVRRKEGARRREEGAV